jgi:hypothetical protein
MPLSIRKLTGRIGAVVEGVDLTGHPRRLNRVKVAGDVPVGVNGRRSVQLVSDASHYSKALEVAA